MAAFFEENPEAHPDVEEPLPQFMSYWRAWHMLRDDRSIGGMGGAGQIYYTALSRYCEDFDIVGDDLVVFMRVLRHMDDEYLRYLTEQSKSKETPNGTDDA